MSATSISKREGHVEREEDLKVDFASDDPDAEFGGKESRAILEKKLLLKLDLR